MDSVCLLTRHFMYNSLMIILTSILNNSESVVNLTGVDTVFKGELVHSHVYVLTLFFLFFFFYHSFCCVSCPTSLF